MSSKKKPAKEITLAEHLSKAGKIGGPARQASMTEEERAAFVRSGGLARAAALTKKQRSEIAKKAAAARWGKKKA